MLDFFSQLTQKGVEVRQSTTDDNEYKICCLFCFERVREQDFKFRCGFNIQSGLGHCFKCGWSSKKALFDIMRQLGAEISDQIKPGNFTGQTRTRPAPVHLPEGFEKLIDVKHDDMVFGEARKYVAKRGITPRQLKQHKIGATVIDGMFHHRIIFPVMMEKELVGIVSRDWTGRQVPKYLNSVGTKVAYNIRPDRYDNGTKKVVVLEGLTKSLAVERALNYKTVCSALLGNSITALQANQLAQFDEVILFPDPDIPGMSGFLGVADSLQPTIKKVTIVWPWPERQADELTPEEILEAIRGRREVTPPLRLRLRQEMQARG